MYNSSASSGPGLDPIRLDFLPHFTHKSPLFGRWIGPSWRCPGSTSCAGTQMAPGCTTRSLWRVPGRGTGPPSDTGDYATVSRTFRKSPNRRTSCPRDPRCPRRRDKPGLRAGGRSWGFRGGSCGRRNGWGWGRCWKVGKMEKIGRISLAGERVEVGGKGGWGGGDGDDDGGGGGSGTGVVAGGGGGGGGTGVVAGGGGGGGAGLDIVPPPPPLTWIVIKCWFALW